jgi:hypothetical protein
MYGFIPPLVVNLIHGHLEVNKYSIYMTLDNNFLNYSIYVANFMLILGHHPLKCPLEDHTFQPTTCYNDLI